MKPRLNILLLIVLTFNQLFAFPMAARANSSRGAIQKVFVDAADWQTIDLLAASGAEKLADYGAFSLWNAPQVATSQVGPSHAQPLIEDGIFLREITLLPGQSELQAPGNLSPALAEEKALWLVQFIGPILPEWHAALLAAGLEIVTYVPNNAYVVWGNQPAIAVDEISRITGAIQYSGAYLPLYRLSPSLRSLTTDDGAAAPSLPDEPQQVTVQFYQTDRLAASIGALDALATRVIQSPEPLLNTTIMRVEVSAQALAGLAAWPDVLNIEPYADPEKLDEIQGQILAGNLVQSSGSILPNAPGYLDWLALKGFPTQPDAYPLVDVVDDGVDSGNVANVMHPDFYLLGNKANASRVAYMKNCTGDPNGNSMAGHGNLNAGIVIGYNNGLGAPYQDAQGYQLGLGISPFGRVASTKIFNNTGRFDIPRCNNSVFFIVNAAYTSGARITSNSWGRMADAAYTTESQIYDALTRDASAETGSQEMLHIFAAGNGGPGEQTISIPGTAKNVFTVGAVENVRDNGIEDGCNVAEANSADDIAEFSSRGPTSDGRAKPDIVAPGTHVQAQASQVSGFNGLGVCGSYVNSQLNPYYPEQQTLYTWSSGTSHAAPAIAGVAQLASNYYRRVLRPGLTPSPAMIKALILNTPRYLHGEYAGDLLPSPTQGWGSADMGKMFNGTPRMFVDQGSLFDQTGQVYSIADQVYDPARPLHATLVWTDAPGSPVAQRALVNDLDLEITIEGQTYHGNMFEGSQSVPDGSADRLNNVENIFLPAGLSGSFEVRVIAHNIAGDGVPNNGVPIDQDFALVIYNGGIGASISNFYVPMVIQ